MDNELELLVTKYLDRDIKELFKLLILITYVFIPK